jgi:hypothetical protein
MTDIIMSCIVLGFLLAAPIVMAVAARIVDKD